MVVLEVLATQAAISIENALLILKERSARRDAEQARERAAFAARASGILSESLDVGQVLARLARLCVASLAEWCVIDVLEGGELHRLAGAHASQEKEGLLGVLQQRFPPASNSMQVEVVQTGIAMVIPEVTEAALTVRTVGDEHAALVRALGTRTAMVVPLRAGGRLIGTLSLAAGAPGRRFGQADLELAQDVAQRAAIAVENAHLYTESQRAIVLRDDFLFV